MTQMSYISSSISRVFYIAVFAAWGLTACRPQGEESNTQGLTTTKLWQKTELTLCWDRQGASQNQRPFSPTNNFFGNSIFQRFGNLNNASAANNSQYETAIQQAVEREYRADTTVIHFVGFQDCSQTPDADVGIQFAEDLPSGFVGLASQMGQFTLPGAEQFFPGITRPTVKISIAGHQQGVPPLRNGHTPTDSIIETALHELGHIAGLFHEHAHPRSTCHITEESAAQKWELFGAVAYDMYLDQGTAYDPYSIMNYCKIESYLSGERTDPSANLALLHAGLSDADKAFLASLYGGVRNTTGVSTSSAKNSDEQSQAPAPNANSNNQQSRYRGGWLDQVPSN